MSQGRPGDNPMSDMLHHGKPMFGEPHDSLVKEIADNIHSKFHFELFEWARSLHPFDREEELKKKLEYVKENYRF